MTSRGFLTPDPLGLDSGDANFYRYVLNNPLKYVDPLGLQNICRDPKDAIGAKFGGKGGVPTGAGGRGGLAGGPKFKPSTKAGGTVRPPSQSNIMNQIKSNPKLNSQAKGRGITKDVVRRAIQRPGVPGQGKFSNSTRFTDPTTKKSITIDNKTGEVFHLGKKGYKHNK